MGKSALNQRVNTFISITFVASLALGAGFIIVKVANTEDYAFASTLILEEEVAR